MEVKKNLPEIFEEFADARKNAFLSVKEIKDNNKPVIGIFCTFFPQELAVAMDAAVVSLCATSDETIPAAEVDLPKNLCPLIKSSYGFGKTDKCPFFYFSDIVVGETTCDGKKKMYEHMAQFKPVHVMELPNRNSEAGVEFYKKQIIQMKEKLEEVFDVTITEEDIKRGIEVKNEERNAKKTLYELMKANPSPISGYELINTLIGTTFIFDTKDAIQTLKDLAEKIKNEPNNRTKRPRILLTGCPMGGATLKVVKAIEDNGADVVFFENCSGAKAVEENVDINNPDIYEALASKYLNIGCSVMTPNDKRFELLDKAIDEYNIDGVIDMTLQACHTYAVETLLVSNYVSQKKNVPYLNVETDYSQTDIGQLNTRITAFIEML